MVIEEKLPEKFKTGAFHPSLFIYAWKRNVLDKLFEEFMASNIAISGGEAWFIQEEKTFGVIPFKNGDKAVLNWQIKKGKEEEWYDFVERSIKESLEVITAKNLEKNTSPSVKNRIYYHFELRAKNESVSPNFWK